MPGFIAHVEFRTDADTLAAEGKRLRELAAAASVGFELKRAQIEPAPDEDDDAGDWTGYGPVP